MLSINRVVLIGRLGKDPEVRSTKTGNAVCSFSVATDEFKGKGESREKVTEWHKVVCFDKTAEIAGEALRKGTAVYVEGKLQTRKWQDKNGNDQWTTEIVAGMVNVIADTGAPLLQTQKPNPYTPTPANTKRPPTEDEDLPF